MEQFGATAGGPIIKDKLFWFVGFEGLRLSTGDPSQVTIPVDVGTGVTPATLAQAQASTNMVNICNFLKQPANGGVSPLSAQLAGLGNFATGQCRQLYRNAWFTLVRERVPVLYLWNA